MRLLALAAAAVALTLTACSPTPPSAPAASEQTAETETTEAPASEEAAEEEPAGADGSRDNPLPAGSTIEGQTWTVTVGPTVLDATEAVAAGQYNDPAPEGQVYISVPVQATYIGDESGYTAEVQIAYVSASGETYDATSALVVADDTAGMEELYNGGEAAWSQYLLVPTEGLTDGLIRVRPGFLDDEKFVSLQ